MKISRFPLHSNIQVTTIAKELDGLSAAIEEALQSASTAQGNTFGMPGIPIVVGSAKGPIRKSNEDRAVAALIARPSALGGPLCVGIVCDGIGGQQRGEESASLAAAIFLATCAQSRAQTLEFTFKEAVEAANDAVHRLTGGLGGTTLAAVGISASGSAAGVNCGDSRIFRLDVSKGVHQLSHDQTVGAAIRKVSPELPYARFEGELANFIGIGRDMQPEFLGLDEVRQDDAIVLASDGAWNAMGDDIFFKILQVAPTHGDAVRRVLATVNFTGGPDNASIVVISSRSEITRILRATRVPPEVLRITLCTPVGRASVIAPVLANSFIERMPSVPAERSSNSELTRPVPTHQNLEPVIKSQGRQRRGRQKRTTQVALDLSGSEANKKAGQRAEKKSGGNIEVVEGATGGNEESSPS